MFRLNKNPKTVHAPVGAYVHQVALVGDIKWLTLSGQIGMNINKQILPDVTSQFEQALKNISLNLAEAEMTVENLTKLVLYFVEPIEAETRGEILEKFLDGNEVCMTLLYVNGLASPEIKVEVDAWAAREVSSFKN